MTQREQLLEVSFLFCYESKLIQLFLSDTT